MNENLQITTVFRFQEQYDIENMMEKLHNDNEITDIQISNIGVSIDKINNQIKIEPLDIKSMRRGYTGCEECDIPYVTKKELKVSFACLV